jgi:hypothetical protein
MADGTRLAQISESLKECHDAIQQQHMVNTEMQGRITEVTQMLQTLVANQNRPPPELPPLPPLPPADNRGYHLPLEPPREERRYQDFD